MKTRDKIVQASLELFNKHGERNISTNHISAHLNMSPGNLYYHFRNKEDIIRSIFTLYESDIIKDFKPYLTQEVNSELLLNYFDTLFNILWNYRFLYNNLADILSRDEVLKVRYRQTQEQVLSRSNYIIAQLKDDGVLIIDESEIAPLADTLKLMTSFWVSYKLTQSKSPIGSISKASLYEGVLRVLLILKTYAAPNSITTFDKLKEHYQEQVTSSIQPEDEIKE
ncbi:TetR/AcrR family transcriptional regulator [Shewanella surugensis]|uniref:TetR/AcrR family transcriptional regulator n=1 Tax=Shewanella surugensis TaxID=212020 RepID=A0ABT0L9Q2_9GAMM|nr:TetR/AcrR family transcriptional regulator [Shewanella surugensis]MCL1124418.1 TetR/AcrR family transcriptional regulator [Shewanella surugensis]